MLVIFKQFLLVIVVTICLSGFSSAQNKCSNTLPTSYLCDPGFEKNSRRDGSPVSQYSPKKISAGYYLEAYYEINRCLGGPQRGLNNVWNDEDHWDRNYTPYNSSIPLYGLPEFLSWFQPTFGTPDYFNTQASNILAVPIENNVSVPDNYAGYQYPAELDGNGYIGILLQFDNAYGTNYKEYVESPLSKALEINKLYEISFKVSHSSKSYHSLDNHTIKEILPFFSNGPISSESEGIPDLSNGEFPQLWTKYQLYQNGGIDGHNWMTVSGLYRVTNNDKNYITIGNYQNIQEITEDVLPQEFSDQLYPAAKIYYYIDDVQIREAIAPYSGYCYCELHNITITPHYPQVSPDESKCCYDFIINSAPITCWYDKVVVTCLNSDESVTYINQSGFPRLGTDFQINGNYFCVEKSEPGEKLNFKFELWGKDENQNPILGCTLFEDATCNCSCLEIQRYHDGVSYEGNEEALSSITIYSKQQDGTCCLDLYIDNKSPCHIPYNVIRLNYMGSNFSQLQFSSFDNGWSASNPQSNQVYFTKAQEVVFPNSIGEKICTICVPNDGNNHPIQYSIGFNDETGFHPCPVIWKDNLLCDDFGDCC